MKKKYPARSSGSVFQDGSDQFQYYNDFCKIFTCGKWYHLGRMQAKVIKQLYFASFTKYPWVFGKELLYKAGSKSIYMRDLFKSHMSWHDLIESDKKGNYRLKIQCFTEFDPHPAPKIAPSKP